jgi:hypothetical protein
VAVALGDFGGTAIDLRHGDALTQKYDDVAYLLLCSTARFPLMSPDHSSPD